MHICNFKVFHSLNLTEDGGGGGGGGGGPFGGLSIEGGNHCFSLYIL